MNDIELSNVYLLSAIMVVFVLAFVEVFKATFPGVNNKYLPLISLVLGLIVAVILYPFSQYSFYTTLISGLVSGLVASGTFDLTKVLKK